MKRLLSFVLVLVIVFSMATVTGAADSAYNYKRHIVTDMYGGTFTFSDAAHGYGVRYYNEDGEYLVSPLIIVDDDCLVKYRAHHGIEKFGAGKNVEQGSAYYGGGITRTYSNMYGKSVVTDNVELYALESVFKKAYKEFEAELKPVLPEVEDEFIEADDVFVEITDSAIEEEVPVATAPAIETGMVKIDILYERMSEHHDDRDQILFLHASGGYLIGVMTETAASAHSGMIDRNGPALDNQTSMFEFGRGYVNEEGFLSYDYTIKNVTDERIDASYAFLTYHKNTHTVDGKVCLGAQITPLEISLAKGETVTGTLVSEYGELSGSVMKLIKFDSEEERDAFYIQEGFELHDHIYCPRYILSDNAFKNINANPAI